VIFPHVIGAGFNASVVIDNGPPVPIPNPENPLFSSSELTPGTHTIVITTLDDNPLSIDYFLVQTGAANSSDSTSTSILTSTALPQETMPVPQPTVNSKSPPIPAVIGGAVTLLLILVLVTVLLWRRRARRNKKGKYEAYLLKMNLG
jgi:hypothetical protein